MEAKRFRPLVDRLYWIILIFTSAVMIGLTVPSVLAPVALWIVIPVDVLVYYFLISPLFGYVELRENTVFIKFGFILKREIPYQKIRGTVKERKLYSESMVSLKNAIEHVNIKYNVFDIVTVSVIDNDKFIDDLKAHLISAARVD